MKRIINVFLLVLFFLIIIDVNAASTMSINKQKAITSNERYASYLGDAKLYLLRYCTFVNDVRQKSEKN